MAKWRLAYTGPVLVVSSGLVYTEITRPKGLVLADILDLIRKHPGAGFYSKDLTRRLTLADALAQDRLDIIGQEVQLRSSIDLYQQEHDREFRKLPKTGGQLLKNKYHSKPVEVKSGN